MAEIMGFLCKLIGLDAKSGKQVYHHYRHKNARRHPMATESFTNPNGSKTDVIYADPPKEKGSKGGGGLSISW